MIVAFEYKIVYNPINQVVQLFISSSIPQVILVKIKHRIAFRAEEQVGLTSYLSGHDIVWKKGEIISSVELFEDNEHWQFVHQYACDRHIPILSSTDFSKSELDNARWLRIRSQWRFGYPQPEAAFGYRDVTYQEGRCEACGAGKKQIAPFRMTKTPVWGKRHFMMLNWVEDELFITDICRSVLEKANLSGICFGAVSDKKGLGSLGNVNQLIIPTTLSPGVIADRRSIDQVYVCADCGAVKYHPTGIGMMAYDEHIFNNTPDFVRTSEVFGWGKGAAHHIIISQKTYHVLIRNKLAQGLVFEPIELA